MAIVAAVAIVWQTRSQHTTANDHGDDHEAALPFLWTSGTDDLAAVELLHGGGRLRFERDDTGAWLLHRDHGPSAGEHAHKARAGDADDPGPTLNTFSRTRTERRLPADAGSRQRFGLEAPELIVLLFDRTNAHRLTVEVGDLGADGLARYIHVPQQQTVYTIPDYQIRGLRDLIDQARR
ncbi:MAG: DUF4340 domain-containing protein [Burkholderiaceae bacterium]